MIRIFRIYIPTIAFLYLLWETFLISGAFIFATYLLIDVDPTDYLLNDSGIAGILLVTLTFIAGLYFYDLYSNFHVKSRVLLLQQLFMITGIAFLLQGLISYLNTNLRVSVRIMLVGSLLAVSGVFIGRILMSNYAIQSIAKIRLLLVGANPILEELDRFIEALPQLGLQIAGYVDDTPSDGNGPPRKSLGSLAGLRRIVQTAQPAQIILGITTPATPALANDLLEIRYAGYDIETAASAYERVCGKVSIHDLNPQWRAFEGMFSGTPREVFYQQVIDKILAVAAIALTAPVMVLVAVALLAAGGRPLLDRQRLAGRDTRAFDRYRFHVDPSTVPGRIIERLWLAGLPQLFNVLKGDMAFVGPEADRPEYVEAIERHIPYYRERYRVPPGMTGWAQIHWSDESTPEDTIGRLEYDLYYVKNMSLSLDTLVLLHTIKVMLMSA
jgi:lipopolysaccharide/colanic/teichoic acid biosynthesis glycosyltransferase